MKFIRTVAAVVIFALACAPALAAACASACAAADLMAKKGAAAAVMVQSMPGCAMHDANPPAQDKNQQNQHGSYHGCGMAGCHFTSAASLAADPSVIAADFSDIMLPHSNTYAVSADLSPPIKPPA